MVSKTLWEGEMPVTQSKESVRALIAFDHNGQEPEEMPEFYRVSADLVLVRSNKGNAYYVTTRKNCSCPAKSFHPGDPCKHQRAYFPQPKSTSEVSESGHINMRSGSFALPEEA